MGDRGLRVFGLEVKNVADLLMMLHGRDHFGDGMTLLCSLRTG